MMLLTKTDLYIIELKLNKSAQTAMQQINLKNYARRFALSGKPITKVGINFDSTQGNIEDWVIEGEGKKRPKKMKRFSRLVILFLLAASPVFAACSSQVSTVEPQVYWAADSAWYQSKDTVCPDKIDLLYLVSTDVVSAKNSDGSTSYRTLLTAADKQAIGEELAYVEENIGQHDFNYVAPYYHQFTFDAISLPADKFKAEYQQVVKEVCEAFDYYMTHKNQGRKFALVGFSQGGMLVLDLLRHMTDNQYRQMVAAYAMGYRISAEDEKCPRIIPASDETTPGVTVSFNSALSTDGIWPLVAADATASINPVNWKTDATPATFTYNGSPHSLHLDPSTHLLIVETDKADEYRSWTNNPVFQSAHVSLDCLHHWDLLFYTQYIHDNIQRRAGH